MADVRDPGAALSTGRVNFAKLDELTEDDIARFNVEDGFDPDDTLAGLRRVYTPAEIRAKAGLTEADMATRLTVPLKTWQGWEQGPADLEPAVLALLALVADDPERALQVLSGGQQRRVRPARSKAVGPSSSSAGDPAAVKAQHKRSSL